MNDLLGTYRRIDYRIKHLDDGKFEATIEFPKESKMSPRSNTTFTKIYNREDVAVAKTQNLIDTYWAWDEY